MVHPVNLAKCASAPYELISHGGGLPEYSSPPMPSGFVEVKDEVLYRLVLSPKIRDDSTRFDE